MEQIHEKSYWRRRLKDVESYGLALHQSIFKCGHDQWARIEAKHRQILAATIGETASVLDCGCAYGRLISLMPETWKGQYLGIDLSPDFIAKARQSYPNHPFLVADLLDLSIIPGLFDWAVLISIRPMVRRYMGDEAWEKMEWQIRQRASKILYLEYDETENGSIE
jgi:SAM-dependent methyltransferase